MSGQLTGAAGFLAALVLTLLGVPVAFAMAITGVVGFAVLNGWGSVGFVMSFAPFEAIFPYGLSVVPLFIAMGAFAGHAGLSSSLFDAANLVVGRFRGGLAIATIGACAVFGAICGSSLATAATMGRIAVPEMLRAGYAPSISAATVAAAGTLGVLIPPSVLMVIYALLTETSVGQLFAGALIPGVVAVAFYVGAVMTTVRLRPTLVTLPARDAGPRAGPVLRGVVPTIGLFALVIGGLYRGWFSPTEAAAVGAMGAVALAILMGASRRALTDAALETARTSAMIFMVLIGAALFNFFLEGTGLTRTLAGWAERTELPPFAVMSLILVFYVALGCFMDSLSMILLTIPVTFPMAVSLGYDPVWFGIIIVSVAEIGLITPPIGMNLFVVQSVAPQVRQIDMIRGILPFILADVLRVAVLLLFPALVLFLPSRM